MSQHGSHTDGSSSSSNNKKRNSSGGDGDDALSLLMSAAAAAKTSKKKHSGSQRRAHAAAAALRRRQSASRFVQCPGGCGKHILHENINEHLDECIPSIFSGPQAATEERKEPADEEALSQSTTNMAPISIASPDSTAAVAAMPLTASPAASQDFDDDDANESPLLVVVEFNKNSESLTLGPSSQTLATQPIVAAAIPVPPEATTDVDAKENAAPAVPVVVQAEAKPVVAADEPKAMAEAAFETVPAMSALQQPAPTVSQAAPPAIDAAPNVFTQMLQNSKQVFSLDGRRRKSMTFSTSTSAMPSARQQSVSALRQYFHLNQQDGRVTLSTMAPAAAAACDSCWTANVKLRNNGRPSVDLVLSASSCDMTAAASRNNGNTTTRLVQKHSKLSVPVLKSILQKAIRRRRPLAAVPVAMELADKALGELLRRLAIIVLEDSSLHDDYALLMWIMMAQSKGFIVTRPLMSKVLQMVYQVACCSWKDSCDTKDNESMLSTNGMGEHSKAPGLADHRHLSLDGFGTSSWNHLGSEQAQLLVWSMLARAEYGGMPCDVEMLHQYGKVWASRLARGALSREQQTHIKCDDAAPSSLLPNTWADVPNAIHSATIRHLSLTKVSEYLQGVEKLRLPDICVEGIDFHCSPIIDNLLLDIKAVEISADMLQLAGETIPHEHTRARIGALLKEFMWTYSAGVNARQPLLVESLANTVPRRSSIWADLFESNARQYQIQYVKQRLV